MAKYFWFGLLLFALPATAADSWELKQEMSQVEDDLYLGAENNPEEILYREFLQFSANHLTKTYRWPSAEEADSYLVKAIDKVLKRWPDRKDLTVSKVDDLLNNQRHFMADFARFLPNKYLYLRRKIASQYIRAVRQSDLKKRYRTVPTTPTVEQFFLSAIKGKTNGGPALLMEVVKNRLSIDHFMDLFVPNRPSAKRTGSFPQPLIFQNGWDEVEKLAMFDAPFAFNNFVDRKHVVTLERAKKTVKAIESSKGFIAVSWSAEKPISELWLQTLAQLAEKKDFVILIGASLNNWDGFPQEILKNPRIHLVTHSLQNSTLKISTEPIHPDVEDPIPEARKSGLFRPGQTVVLFHPHLRLETVPTGSNSLAPVMILSTGSINEPFGPYSSASQGRRRRKAKAFHKQKAWVFEKADGASSHDADGTRNLWHPVPITFYDDRSIGGGAGTIYRGEAYEFSPSVANGALEFNVRSEDPLIWYLGDKHVPHTDPEVVHSMLNDLDLNPLSKVTFQSGDTFDFSSIAHWSNDKKLELNLKFQRGDIFLLEQVNAVIDALNALLQRFPNARFRMIVGNHDEWLNKLLDMTPDHQAMINGDFIDELSFVAKNMGWNLWEYIFMKREAFWASILSDNPAQRQQILRRLHPVFAVDRIDIVRRGDDLIVGPPNRKNDVARHGDRASFGMKRPSLKAHSLGMPEGGGIVGDSHRPGIYSEVYDVGTFSKVDPEYGKGFTSAVGQAIGPLYRNGIKELWIYNRQARSFRQRQPQAVARDKDFFGDDPLQIVIDDNELVAKEQDLARIQKEIECMNLLINPKKPKP